MIQPNVLFFLHTYQENKSKMNWLTYSFRIYRRIFWIVFSLSSMHMFSTWYSPICHQELELKILLKIIFYSTNISQISLQVTDTLRLTASVNADTPWILREQKFQITARIHEPSSKCPQVTCWLKNRWRAVNQSCHGNNNIRAVQVQATTIHYSCHLIIRNC